MRKNCQVWTAELRSKRKRNPDSNQETSWNRIKIRRKNKEYLEEFKIQAVKRIYAGGSQKGLCQELGISKSTLWGWKCKYGLIVDKELETKEKPVQENEFIEIIKPMKETKHKPIYQYETANTVIIEYKGFKIICEIQKLNQVMEILKW